MEEIKEKAGLDMTILEDEIIQEVQNYLTNRLQKVEALAKKRGV